MTKQSEAANLFPVGLPKSWMAGFVHHHTAFGYPVQHCVSPNELRKEVAELGGDFVFCAGDHGLEIDGKVCPYWYEGKDYYDLVLAANEEEGVFLIPTGEYHLWFPELAPRDQNEPFWEAKRKWPSYQPFHHTLIPMIEWTDAVCRYVRESTSSAFVDKAMDLGIATTLNHPGLCYLSGHPDPLSASWLKKMSYLEIFDTMDHFDYDWALYKCYLSRPDSCRMGIYAGVDFCSHKGFDLSTPGNERAEHITYIQSPQGRSLENLYDAWCQRRTVAVRGRLFLEHIDPAPRKQAYATKGLPEISFVVRSFGEKKIRKIEILKNGLSVYCEYLSEQEVVERNWCDKTFEGLGARYTLVVEGEGDWLITSPIGFKSDSPCPGFTR